MTNSVSLAGYSVEPFRGFMPSLQKIWDASRFEEYLSSLFNRKLNALEIKERREIGLPYGLIFNMLCWQNVIYPCIWLNCTSSIQQYEVCVSLPNPSGDFHVAILNRGLNVVTDPTYCHIGLDENTTMSNLGGSVDVVSISDYLDSYDFPHGYSIAEDLRKIGIRLRSLGVL